MNVRSGDLRFGVFLLLAAAAPLRAQFTAYGCPSGVSQIDLLNGFTAASPSDAQICLLGTSGTWSPGLQYRVDLRDTATGATAQIANLGPNSPTLLIVTVPHTFFASVQTPGQPDPVTITVTVQSVSAPPPLTGTFQINPPMSNGAPILYGEVNQPVLWTLYSGGTGPWSDGFSGGNPPPGMSFPQSGQTWGGTPTQTGASTFQMTAFDSWDNQFNQTLSIVIVPRPQITSLSETSTVAGAPSQTIDILGPNTAGFGFVSPFTLGSTPIPGSTVSWTAGSITTPLTVTNYSSGDLTVTVPASLLTTTGPRTISVSNPGTTTTSSANFRIDPTITALSTYTRTAGLPAFQLGVTGTGFVNGSVVRLNGTAIPTTFVSTTGLTATFPAVTALGTASITVINPDNTVTPLPQNLSVVQAPTVSTINPTSVNAGSPAFPLTVTGAHFLTGATVYFNSAPVPTTLVNNQQNNQLIANIPASAITTAGIVPVQVGTLDGYVTPAISFNIISTGPPPLQLLTFSPLPNGTVGAAYSTTFQASQGTPPYTFSVIAGTLPAGLQLSAAGVLSGTPTAYGASQFTVQVADSAQTALSRVFALNIAPAPLQLTTGPLSNTQVNTPVNVQFAGTGGIPPYTFVEFGALPAGVSMSSSGLLSGTPAKAGSFPFLVFIDDTTGASARQNYTLNVALPGLLITPPSPLPAGQINQPYTTQLAATGGLGSPYFWSASGLPNGLTIANNSGLIAGIPRAAGTFTIAISVSDNSGASVTQSYTLVIASASLTIINPPLPNGAVGGSYSAIVTASGGSGNYSFSATGLPPGISLSTSGVLSGTPTAAGSYSIIVTATDSTAATAPLTATATFPVTIAPRLVVTPTTLPNAVAGTAMAPTQLAATGGTPPYQFQSPNLPPGLVLASNGTLSGTPTAGGTFSFTVFAVDSSGTLASGTETLTVTLPTAPTLTISGLPASTAPATQQFAQVSLANPFPATVTANLTLTFAPTSGADDPAVQFATGGRTAQIVVPAGSTTGLTAAGIQTGTVAGIITITARLLAGTVDVTPTPAPSRTIQVTAGSPVITNVTATRTANGFTVTVTGFASNRGVDSAAFTFSPAAGSNLQTTQLTTTDTSLFAAWYSSSASAPFGSQFTLSQPFTVNGSPSSLISVTVTLTNALGTSPAASGNLQ